jgi:WD40 repeat protein
MVFHANCSLSSSRHVRACLLRYWKALLLLGLVTGVAWLVFDFLYVPGLQKALIGHQGRIMCVVFSPDGNSLATSGSDGTVRIWSIESGAQRAVLTGHVSSVPCVTFSSDGKMLASAGYDGTVRIWDVEIAKQCDLIVYSTRLYIDGSPLHADSVAFSPDGTHLAIGGADDALQLWDIAAGKKVAIVEQNDGIGSIVFSPNGRYLISMSYYGCITEYDMLANLASRRLSDRTSLSSPGLLLIGDGGKLLASNAHYDPKVQLLDVQTGESTVPLRAEFAWQDAPTSSMAFAPGRHILVATTMYGARMIFWDTRSGEMLGYRHFPRADSIAVSPNGLILASGHNDGTINLWDFNRLLP